MSNADDPTVIAEIDALGPADHPRQAKERLRIRGPRRRTLDHERSIGSLWRYQCSGRRHY
jgi:hypothetical protein